MSKESPGFLTRLFRGFWNLITWLRISLFNLVFLALLLALVVAMIPQEEQRLTGKRALRVAPSGFLVDQRSYVDPVTQILEQSRPEEVETLVSDLVKTINHAARDERITALVLELDYLVGGGISKLEEIGTALQRFKVSGKPIIAVADNYSQEQYYLASYADEIYLHPMGGVLLTGYGSYRNYFKNALDKLAVNFHVFRVGDYKDFIEPYTRNNMSAASREHNALWLQQLWGVYTSRLESLRGLPNGAVNSYINNLDENLNRVDGNSARLALNAGLVDQLAGRRQVRQTLKQKLGSNRDGDNYNALDYWDYLHHLEKENGHVGGKVGLIVAKGIIVDGKQPEGTIGGDTMAKLLREAREDASLKALVLRIDSGGGSAFASEVIRQEILATRQAGIPVIVSMGSVAASGGYWIASAGDEIWATPTTITGSIGVFGAFPTFELTLDKLGVSTDGIGTTKLAGAMRVDRPLSPQAESVIQQSVEFVYKQFLNLVAEARDSSVGEIHRVAQGRVWSGATAKELGLVDNIGNLEDAVAAAAARAGLNSYHLHLIRKTLSPKEQILKELAGGVSALAPNTLMEKVAPASLRKALTPLAEPFQLMGKLNDPRGVYTLCEVCTAP